MGDMDTNLVPEQVLADCRLRAVVELIAHRWDLVVLAALHEGQRRRGELLGRIGGLSDKSLTEALQRLLAAGLIEKRRYQQAPPRVDYFLTDLGAGFLDGPVRELGRWIADHGDAVLAAQDRASDEIAEIEAGQLATDRNGDSL